MQIAQISSRTATAAKPGIEPSAGLLPAMVLSFGAAMLPEILVEVSAALVISSGVAEVLFSGVVSTVVSVEGSDGTSSVSLSGCSSAV